MTWLELTGFTTYVYISKARMANGQIWEYDPEIVRSQVKFLSPDISIEEPGTTNYLFPMQI